MDNYLAPLIFLLDAPLKFLISPFCLFFPLSHCLLPKPHHPPPLSQCAITSSTPKHTHTQICAPLFPPYHHNQRESSSEVCKCKLRRDKKVSWVKCTSMQHWVLVKKMKVRGERVSEALSFGTSNPITDCSICDFLIRNIYFLYYRLLNS